jgi:proprotein convertase subtilisin/kexin type 5
MCTASFLHTDNVCHANCPNGFYNNANSGNPICTACHASCLTCNAAGANACTKCATLTSFLHSVDNSCMATCPNGYYGNANAGNPLCTLCEATCL